MRLAIHRTDAIYAALTFASFAYMPTMVKSQLLADSTRALRAFLSSAARHFRGFAQLADRPLLKLRLQLAALPYVADIAQRQHEPTDLARGGWSMATATPFAPRNSSDGRALCGCPFGRASSVQRAASYRSWVTVGDGAMLTVRKTARWAILYRPSGVVKLPVGSSASAFTGGYAVKELAPARSVFNARLGAGR